MPRNINARIFNLSDFYYVESQVEARPQYIIKFNLEKLVASRKYALNYC